MKNKGSLRLTFYVNVALIFGMVSLFVYEIRGQALPKPAITKVRASQKLLINNAGSGEPVELVSELLVSNRAYGSRFLTMKNTSNKPILALRGEFIITSQSGAIVRNGWKFGGGTSVVGGGIALLGERKIPISGPSQELFEAPDKIRNIRLKTTGVVFADKSYWGNDGYAMYQMVSSDVKNLLLVSTQVRRAIDEMAAEEFVQQIRIPVTADKKPHPKLSLLDEGSRMNFEMLLVDPQTSGLRVGAREKMDTAISRLKTF